MEYKLYTLIDITSTGQYRPSSSSDKARWQEQNFNTLLQTLGIRANITYRTSPELLEIKGRLVGFDTDDIIRVWRFDFYTERDNLFEKENDPIKLLLEDFHLVPYIQGLNEVMEQKYAVFNCYDPGKNISFFIK